MNDEICIDKRANSQSLGPEPPRFPIQGYVYYEGCRTPVVNVSSLKVSRIQETSEDEWKTSDNEFITNAQMED